MAVIRRKAPRGKKGKRKKKAGKHEAKADKQQEAERAKANVSLWESMLKATEFSRSEYRDAARSLARNNEQLTNNQYQLEKDMLDVIGFMKRQDMEKDELVTTHRKQITDLEEKCAQKAAQMQILMSELKLMKEFRRRKPELERELDQIKDSLLRASQDHREALASMERRMLQEKQRLEKEAEKKIIMLTENAHTEAVIHVGEAGRSVFKENVRLKEALSYHVNEARELQKSVTQLQARTKQLLLEQETSEQLVQEKVLQGSQKSAHIQELQLTVRALEQALQAATLEKEGAIQKSQLRMEVADQAERVELQKLQKMLEMKDRELNRVKKLSHNILQERTEVERFFLEALEQVKQEIKSSRSYYQKMAQAAYHSRMLQAAAGTEQYPKIRTFHNKDHSTNDVSQDLTEAEKWSHLQAGRVDVGDLTWEQKEKVLRLLFAKMNGSVIRKRTPGWRNAMVPAGKKEKGHRPREHGEMAESSSTVFITQHVTDQSLTSLVLPDIHMLQNVKLSAERPRLSETA
ncbi:basal body-orientation factor 1 isoform X2 [Pseudophryne corroboree]|uniref:basal body-orientation factor 1 isoform X2 n=1 Tax=Pseudophryne corroboree TaxID=495146 RepID=UPI0030812C9C